MLAGLKNYNILQNAKYKEAFAITTDFAAQHKTVRHVRKMKYKAQDAQKETAISNKHATAQITIQQQQYGE